MNADTDYRMPNIHPAMRPGPDIRAQVRLAAEEAIG